MAHQIKSNLLDEIDLAERYMVCGLFNEACSLASSQIQKLRTSLELINEIELSGMMDSAGMVFVQSLRESGRTTELFAELTPLFGSVEAIPVQAFLTCVCMQISEGITSDLTPIFEKFFEKWRYVDDDHYAFLKDDANLSKCPWQLALDLGKYLEVAEVFAMVLLGRVLCQPELAISWTENSDLPEDKRQDMLRRLRSMCLTANSSSSIKPASVKTVERVHETSSGSEALGESTNSSSHMKLKSTSSKATNPSFKHLTHQKSPLWWFSAVHLKFGGIHMVLPRGRIVLVGLVLAFASYFLRSRASALRKLAWRQALLIRRILIDAWQLAFSVHLNPLAAVQQGSLPSSASSR